MSQSLRNSKGLNLSAQGTSMFPYIRHGETISLIKKNTLEEGDIVAFMKKNEIVLHRLVKIEKDKVITKGDFNIKFDMPILKKKIIGVAQFNDFRNCRILNVLLTKYSFIIGKLYKYYKSNYQANK